MQETISFLLAVMAKLVLLFFLLFLNPDMLFAQDVTDLFSAGTQPSGRYREKVRELQSLEIKPQRLAELHSQSPVSLRLSLPFGNKSLKLSLHKVKITADNFSVKELRTGNIPRTVEYTDGIFYQGTIEGNTRSMATISIFGDRVMGVIADEISNIVLGTIEDNGRATNEYVLYRDTDLTIPNPFNCVTQDSDSSQYTPYNTTSNNRITAVGEPVDIYIECDYQLYVDKGSSINNVINYTLGFFNNVALIYANESIHIQVSEIAVWSGLDPEAAALLVDGIAMLNSFALRLGDFNGDYAHMITTRTNSGGGFLIDAPCSGFPPKRFHSAVSGINSTYADFPVFSWTVFVFAHELGHNLGSNHTHWCGWPVGALDNCYDPEGACAGPPPVNGGTIMSYCTRSGNYINLANGFGFYPGNKIRSVVAASPCLGACRMTIELTKENASCGLNNGSASIIVYDAVGDVSYTWSNGQTGSTLQNVGPGTYHVTAKDATGCQVMQVVTIINTGPVMNVALNPERTTGFCPGNTVALTATLNTNYTYQWYKDGLIIPAANSHTYIASTAGNYSVNVSQDFCLITRSVTILEVANPSGQVIPSGTISFCSGNPNELNAYAGPGYYYQWYKDGSAINGAIDSVYSVQESASYSVKVSAQGCEATSLPIAATVNPSPEAVITLGSNNQFCEGQSLTLFASSNSAYSYQWYRNAMPIAGAANASYTTSTGGEYRVVTTLASCSRTSAPVIAVVLARPTVVVSPVLSSIQKFQTQTLSASGANTYNWAVQPDIVSFTNNAGIVKPLSTTTYLIEGTNNNGCKGSASATVIVTGCGDVSDITSTVYSPSRAMIRWKNPAGTTGDSLQYRNAGTSNWTSIFVNGESYELNGLDPGTTYEYNIIPLCNTVNTIPSPTNIFQTDPLLLPPFIRLFPNPARDVSRLEIIMDHSYSLQIGLYDGIGRQVSAVQAVENRSPGQTVREINVAHLASGLYYLVISIDGKKQGLKLLINH